MIYKLHTFQEQLIVQQSLVRLEVEHVQWQIADFLSLKVSDGVLDITLVVHRRVQLRHRVFQLVKVITIPLQLTQTKYPSLIHLQHLQLQQSAEVFVRCMSSLPNDLRLSDMSLETFRSRLKAFLFGH